jgi:hypothetical protein
MRAALGITLAQIHRSGPDLVFVALGGAAMTALASMYVTMQWALDALGQVVPGRDESLPTNRYRRTLERMSHLAPLLRQARVLEARSGDLAPVDALPSDAIERMSRERALEAVSSCTWWNAMFVAAMPLAAMVGLRAVGPYASPPAIAVALLAVAGALATVLGYGGDHTRAMPGGLIARPSPVRALMCVAATSAAVWLVACGGTHTATWIVLLPTMLVGGVYVFFRHASRAEVLIDPAEVVEAVARALMCATSSVLRVVVGPAALLLLRDRHPDVHEAREPAKASGEQWRD